MPRYTPRMNTHLKAAHLKGGTFIAVMIAASLLLAGCGNKGPLVLPTPQVDPAPQVDAAPAEITPADPAAPAAEATPEQAEPTPPSDNGNG